MTAQPSLFDPGPQDGALTARQQTALDAILAEQDGLAADEIGAVLHELKDGRWRHDRGERCAYCGKDGRAVLEALKARGLVRRNRLGIYRATGKATPAPPTTPTAQGRRFAATGDDLPF